MLILDNAPVLRGEQAFELAKQRKYRKTYRTFRTDVKSSDFAKKYGVFKEAHNTYFDLWRQ